MPNVLNYVTHFENVLRQKYVEELKTVALTTNGVNFTGHNTVQIPYLTLAGYKDHSRSGGFNRQDIKNEFQTLPMKHDRNVEFFIDTMDVDETYWITAAANITATFEREHAIPETDAYRISKIYNDVVEFGGNVSETALDVTNILITFDEMMEEMDNNEVPMEGRYLYVTPTIAKFLKYSSGIDRTINVQQNNGSIGRTITRLDDVTISVIPPARMKTMYDFTDGFVPAVGAKQINMMLIHPSSVLAVNKHSFIGLYPPGTHTQGDGYLYQNRQYWDAWVIKQRIKGIAINVEPDVTP